MPDEEPDPDDVFVPLRQYSDEELLSQGFSRGEILTIRDFKKPQDLMDQFSIFYQLKAFSEAAGKRDRFLEGLTGNDFKNAVLVRFIDYQTQYSPFDYYGYLKEKVEPVVMLKPVSEGMNSFIKDMERSDARRERRGKPPTFTEAIRQWKESLDRVKNWEQQTRQVRGRGELKV